MPILAQNKKARFDYEVLEKFEAGVQLLGYEVKSIRAGQASLEGAYVIVRGSEAFLIYMSVPPYQPKNTRDDYEPRRNRKLLLTRKEIATISQFENKKGLSVVPLSLFTKHNKIKVELAIVRGKKKWDKRETLKKREAQRDISRELKSR